MIAGRPDPAAAREGRDPRLDDAAQQVEAMLLRQLFRATGAFKGGSAPGAGVREDMFADALADAVARAGGLGLADSLARSIDPAGGRAEFAGTMASARPAPMPGPGPSATAAGELRRGAALDPAALAAATLGRESLGQEPVAGRVTSRFGGRADPFTGNHAEHHGIDVGAPEGTPIVAPAAGVVRSAGPRGGYGNAVELDHGNGVVTLYAHASEITVVPGQAVEAGAELGRVGSTGRSTGPHLHFELRVAGRPVDPAKALKIYSSRAEETLRTRR